jgi:hypothetical protein
LPEANNAKDKESTGLFFDGCLTKKADVPEHPKEFKHVGLLVNEPPGQSELLFI